MRKKRFAKTCTKILLWAGYASLPACLLGQTRTEGIVDSGAPTGLFGLINPKPGYIRSDGTPAERGVPCAETLRGGSSAGYTLSHGGIIPSSLRVSVGARSLREGVDFYLDPANGTLAFAEPVGRFDSVRASYRYVESADKDRSPLGLQGLALNFQGLSLNFGFGTTKDKVKGIDFTTYGLGLNSKIGASSSLSSLFYLSTPAASSGNRAQDFRLTDKNAPKIDPNDLASDHLFVQGLNVKAGSTSFRASFQDIGKKFNGFQAMRQANGRNADMLAQIAAMEKERGVQRLGFGAGLQLNKKDSLGIDWDKIGDGGDSILKQSLGFKSGLFNLNYSTRAIGESFSRFADLREADKTQWAKEKGITRSDLTLGFAASKTSMFNFVRSTAGDKNGSLDRQSLSFASKTINFLMSSRNAAPTFARLADLTDADKTSLALDIRRQFDPNAAATTVTAKDREQIKLDSGLKREQIVLSSALGKQASFSFNRFDISDGTGDINRQSLNLSTSRLNMTYLDQRIAEGFSRLGKMSEFERTQFANEAGIHRNSLGLTWAIAKGTNFGFTQLALNDKTGGIMRQGITYDAKGLSFKLNMANTDKDFARSADLAMPEVDRKAVEAERGFKRLDLNARFTGIKGLTLDTYTYDAKNIADDLTRSIYNHKVVWANGKGMDIAMLMDGSANGKSGAVQDSRAHEMFSFDDRLKNGIKFNLLHDSLATTALALAAPTVITDLLHFETNRTRANNALIESKRIRYSDGKFENTDTADIKYCANKSLTMRFNTLRIDRGANPSSATDTVDWKWAANKGLNVTGTVAETKSNNDANASVRSLGVNSAVTKNINVAAAFSEVNQHKVNSKAVKDIAVNNVKPVNLGPFKHITMTAKYASLTDQHKKQNELSGGKIEGLIGKSQVCAEYGGKLEANGNEAIARTLSIMSDRNAKLPLHFDMLYKSRNINRGEVRLVRKYNAALKAGKRTSLVYAYTSLPEDAAGNPQPTKTEVLSIRDSLSKDLKFSLDYSSSDDLSKKTMVSKFGAAISGRLDKMTAVEVGVSVDNDVQNGLRREGQTVRLSYDHQVDGDHFITIGTSYSMRSGASPNELQANVDLKTRF